MFTKLKRVFRDAVSILEEKPHSMYSATRESTSFSFYSPDNKELYTYTDWLSVKSYETDPKKITKPGWVKVGPSEHDAENLILGVTPRYGYFFTINNVTSENGKFEICYCPDKNFLRLNFGEARYEDLNYGFGIFLGENAEQFDISTDKGLNEFLNRFAHHIKQRRDFKPGPHFPQRSGGYTLGNEGT